MEFFGVRLLMASEVCICHAKDLVLLIARAEMAIEHQKIVPMPSELQRWRRLEGGRRKRGKPEVEMEVVEREEKDGWRAGAGAGAAR